MSFLYTFYIASSWRNQHAVEMFTEALRRRKHRVLSFVEQKKDHEPRTGLTVDVAAWIASAEGAVKFHYDTDAAVEADATIYIGPSGCDAWAEVGVAWASGRPVFGLWAKGEPVGLMRRMVSWHGDYRELLQRIDAFSRDEVVLRKRGLQNRLTEREETLHVTA